MHADARRWDPKGLLRRGRLLRLALLAALVLIPCGLWLYLRPDTWRYYTDDVAFSRLARDARPRLVLWKDAEPVAGVINTNAADLAEPAFSPDGSVMVFTRGGAAGNADLFFSRWDGTAWGLPEPARALNSPFHERSPAFSRDGAFLFFSTDRPGGPGRFDIWIARWDGVEFAWPLPLTREVNSPFDDLGPAPSPDGAVLYFASDRPRERASRDDEPEELAVTATNARAADFDLFSANRIPAGVTNREVERAISMLYYLRESALRDESVMAKLGGSPTTEAAVDRALDWLARNQEPAGLWSLSKHGGSGGHDVAATAVALLAFFGRGHRHDLPGPYRDNVSRGLHWLMSQQTSLGLVRATGNLYDHGIATLALGEAYGLSKDEQIYDAAQDAVDFIVDNQNASDGAWRYDPGQAPGDMSVSGWQIMALKNAELSGLEVPQRTFDGIRKWLRSVAGGASGGIYGYQGHEGASSAMLATGYFCSQLMGLSPNTLRSFETSDEMTKRVVTEADLYYAYYGTLAANQNQGPLWRKWRADLQSKFVTLQNPDGSWTAQGQHADRMGKAITTALVALSLQAHYRYTPLYGLGYEPDRSRITAAALERDQLPSMPAYRRAKRRWDLSSPSDDLHPAPTLHGDFLYFASARAGGAGGFDLYRSRISGKSAEPPRNLGGAVNRPGDELDPDTRYAGFDLAFSSNRGQADPNAYRLFHSLSRHVEREIARSGRIPLRWFLSAFRRSLLLAALMAAVAAFCLVHVRRRARREWRRPDGRFRSDRFTQDWGWWVTPVASVCVILGVAVFITVRLNNTIWCWYTDGEGIRRNALDADVRLVLWETRRAPGQLDPLPAPAQATFSADGNTFVVTPGAGDATNAAPLASTWDGRQWSKLRSLAGEPAPPVSSNSATGGGFRYSSSRQEPGCGGQDLYRSRVRSGRELAAQNLGREVNSERDEVAPAVRMEGFELLFCSNREGEPRDAFAFHAATAREVVGRTSLARWTTFCLLVDRVKWWLLAVLAAVAGLVYLARHMRDITSLYHKCLLVSVALHLVALLLMASWVLSREFMDSMASPAMHISVDADALAREKLALDLEGDVTRLADIPSTPAAEPQQAGMELPKLEARAADVVAPAMTKAREQSFFEHVEATLAEPVDHAMAKTRLEQIPDMEIAPPEVTLEVAKPAPAAAMEPPDEPSVPRPEVTAVRVEPRGPQPAAKPVETPPTPAAPAMTVDVPIAVKTPVAAAAAPAAAKLARVEAADRLPSLDLPRPDLQLEAADRAESPQARDEFRPEAGGAPQMEAAAYRAPDTRAETRIANGADVPRHAVTASVTRVSMDAPPGLRLAFAEPAARPAAGAPAALTDLPLQEVQVTLESRGAEAVAPAASGAAQPAGDATAPAAWEASAGLEQAAPTQPAPASAKSLPGSRDVPASPASERVEPGPAAAWPALAALADPARQPVGTLPALRLDHAEPMLGLELAMPAPSLEAPAANAAPAAAATPEPSLPAAAPAPVRAERRASGVPAPGPAAPRAEAADVQKPDSGSILGDAARLGGVRTAFTPGLTGAGMPKADLGQDGIPSIATRGPDREFQIDAPGELAVPENLGVGTVPEVLKNPSELSDQAIEGLGGSRDTQASIGRALDWFTANQERSGCWSLSRHGGDENHNVGGAGLVLLCYYGWGAKHTEPGPYREPVRKALAWLTAQMRENGDLRGWLVRRYEEDRLLGNMYDHAIATIALSEAYAITGDPELREPVTRAIRFLLDAQEPSLGGWRYQPNEDSDTSVLGWAYMALKSARLAGIEVPPEALAKADAWLSQMSCGADGGLYGYQKAEPSRPAMIATGMFCRQLAGVPRADPRMLESAGFMAVNPLRADEVDYYYLYYATLALYQQQGAAWETWNRSMKEILLAQQHKTGRATGTWDPSLWYGETMGRVVTTALSTLSLEVYFRILPIYGFNSANLPPPEMP